MISSTYFFQNTEDDNELPEETEPTDNVQEGNNEDTFRPPNIAIRPKKKSKNDDTVVREAVECMRTLTNTVGKRDSFTVYGEHVANKLRECGSKYAVTIAQHHIDNILFNLGIGNYTPGNSPGFPSHPSSSHSSVDGQFNSTDCPGSGPTLNFPDRPQSANSCSTEHSPYQRSSTPRLSHPNNENDFTIHDYLFMKTKM